jgi:Na+/melibiose symporter-like transporter
MGRRRPFLLLAPVLYGVVVLLHVLPPSWLTEGPRGPLLVAVWFGLTYIAFFAFDTIFNVPYFALLQELTTDMMERNRIFFCTIFASFVGLLVSTGMPAFLSGVMDVGLSIVVTVIHLVVLYAVGMWGSFKWIREAPPPDAGERPAFAASFTRVVATRAMRILTASYCLDYGSLYTLAAMLPFYIQYHVITPASRKTDCARVPDRTSRTPHPRAVATARSPRRWLRMGGACAQTRMPSSTRG